ncbi:unnamed protein product [Alternaria alternata]
MSAYIETAWPCQQNLNIREIQATPVALIRFPLQITGLNYESPSTCPDIELVETNIHLAWLVEKYELFLARKRLARLSDTPTTVDVELPWHINSLWMIEVRPRTYERGYYVAPGMPKASDEWLVHKPYDPLVDTHTERPPVASTPTSRTLSAPGTRTLSAPGTPVRPPDRPETRVVRAGTAHGVAMTGLDARRRA